MKLKIGVPMINNPFRILLKSLLVLGSIGIIVFYSNIKNVRADSDNLEDKLFKRIETSAGVNNLEKVKDDIKRVLKLNPKHVGATFYAGKYCFQQGNFENAEKFLKRVAYDPVYGPKANAILADIKLKKYSNHFMQNLKVYLSGQSFDQALQLCEEALTDMPDNKELLFSASYAACMLDKKAKAEIYADLYALQSNNSPLAAELKTLVSAWFTENFDDDVAIEKFLSIKSKSLMTAPVKRRIKDLLIANKSFDKYEEFIRNEIEQPGSDKDSLQRELIGFLLKQHQFKRALELLSQRPIESIEDNILYAWALCETGQELKALDVTRSLIAVAPRDLRAYKAWCEAWLSYTERNKAKPEGNDNTGAPYQDTIEKIFKLIRPDKLVNQEPELLIDMLRIAVLTGREFDAHKIHLEVAKIAFKDDHESLLIKTCDDLVPLAKDRMAIYILESAANQLPNNYNLTLKLAQIYMLRNPNASIKICEELMEQRPDLIRALIMWCDAMNLAGRGGEAVSVLVKKLSDKSLNKIAVRQLNSKLEELRIQGNTDTPYMSNSTDEDVSQLFEEDSKKSDKSDNVTSSEDSQTEDEIQIEEDSQSEESTSDDVNSDNYDSSSDINTYSPPNSEEDYENLDDYETTDF